MSEAAAVKTGWKFTRAEVGAACKKWAPFIHPLPEGLDAIQLMWAFALNESYHEPGGILSCPPRFEAGYWFGGRYCQPGSRQYELNTRFGKDGAKSYGNWQVMLCNTGFKPEEFTSVDVGAQAFLSYINNMLATQHPKTLEEMADSYNTGNFKDRNVPEAYIARIKAHYYQDILG